MQDACEALKKNCATVTHAHATRMAWKCEYTVDPINTNDYVIF